MIGAVIWKKETLRGRAVLHEDRTWTFDGDPEAIDHLEQAALAFDMEDEGPADGPFGGNRLRALAELVRGEIRWEPKRPGPPDAIY